MTATEWLLAVLSLSELILLAVLASLFWRLRKSEAVLGQLQDRQAELLSRLQLNARLEHELVATFEKRQAELSRLDEQLDTRAKALERLIQHAEKTARSPQFLREVVIAGLKRGQSALTLAKSTGLSVDEVELIIEQSRV
jgi:biopolymer transport protein ExbB/TolQ